MWLCAIIRVSIHGLRAFVGDTEVSARKVRGAALGNWNGRGGGGGSERREEVSPPVRPPPTREH